MKVAFSGSGDHRAMMSDINVTPLVDVMLVLLIIFMVTAPMMTQGMDVNLPKVDTKALRTEGKNVVVTINSGGQIFMDEFLIPQEEVDNLAAKLKNYMDQNSRQEVHLRADQTVPYGQVARVMAQIQQAGVANLGLVTEPESLAAPPTAEDLKKEKEKKGQP
ncbi:MAG: protein TolR [Thermodesulfobacteriota bacterium]